MQLKYNSVKSAARCIGTGARRGVRFSENGSSGVCAVEFGLLISRHKDFRDSDRSSNPVLWRQPKSISVTYHRKEYFQEMNAAPSDSPECLTSFRQSHCSDTRCGQFLLGFFQEPCFLVPGKLQPMSTRTTNNSTWNTLFSDQNSVLDH